MKRLSGRNRLLLAVLAVTVVAGVGGGIVLTGGSSEAAAGPPGVVARGDFESVSWGTRGTATIERDSSGELVLRFDDGFATKDAPDLLVYLVEFDSGGDRAKWRFVAELKSASGRQRYDLPGAAAKMLDYSVEIYCETCNKTNGVAKLRQTRLARS